MKSFAVFALELPDMQIWPHKAISLGTLFFFFIITTYWPSWAWSQWAVLPPYATENSTIFIAISQFMDLQVEDSQVSRGIFECEHKFKLRSKQISLSFSFLSSKTLHPLLGRLGHILQQRNFLLRENKKPVNQDKTWCL